MAAHQYWRLKIVESTQANYVYVAELALATTPSGATVTTGGTASASSIASPFGAAKAFDANSSTYWSTAPASYATLGGRFFGYEWLQYSLASPADIVEMRITAFTSSYPVSFVLFYSDDGVHWYVQAAATGLSWTSGETKTFDVTYVAPEPGRLVSKLYRRIGSTAPQTLPIAMPARTNTPIRARNFVRPLRRTNGTGQKRIAGTTTVLGVPVARTVYLLEQRSLQILDVRHTASDGIYEFDGVADKLYTVIGEDRTGTYNSIIYANVAPVD